LAGGEHVPAGDDDRVLDGTDCAAVTAAGAEALILGGEVGAAAHAGGSERGFLEGGAEPLGALAGVSGAGFACGSVVAGALAGPAGEVPGAGEAAHVGADLGQDYFGGAPLHAGDRAEQLNRWGER